MNLKFKKSNVMRNKIYIIGLLMFSLNSFAQQDAQFTQYMYNTMSINPAYAGSRDVFSAVLLHRSQWVGLEGAPNTQTLSIHSPIGDNNKIGLGLSIIHDKIGPTQETYFDIDFSYNINLSETGKLYFGLKAGGHLLDVDFNKLNQYDPSDDLLSQNINNKFSPNFGFGLYYKESDVWYAGLSLPNLLETKHFTNDESSQLSTATEKIHLHIIGGYVFDLNDYLKFKPAFLFKAVSGAPLQADISANFLYDEKLTFGAAYRLSAAFSAMVGYQISNEIFMGFAYDREITELGNTLFNSGSYEVFLRFEIGQLIRTLSPRFF